jgi:uncharacterized protein
MDAKDRAAIERLFCKLSDFHDRAPARDPQAEAFIRRAMADLPGAAYYMAQTVVAQEQALKDAEARIAALEGRTEDGWSPPPREQRAAQAGPWGRPGAGGFLAGAAQTAFGVAGGVMLANALGGLFGGEAAAEDDLGAFDGAEDADDFSDLEF